MDDHEDLPRILMEGVDPAQCTYEQWLNVGMALHDSGHPCSVWEEWSRKDATRFHEGECARKWAGFGGSTHPVKSGTIIALARAQGYSPAPEGHELDWNDTIGGGDSDLVVIDRNWLQDEEVPVPEHFNPAGELIAYLETLFEAGENVGINTECWQNADGRWLPTKGSFDRTAGELIRALYGCNGDIGSVIGDWKPEAGAWIRFNPLDGKGVRDEKAELMLIGDGGECKKSATADIYVGPSLSTELEAEPPSPMLPWLAQMAEYASSVTAGARETAALTQESRELCGQSGQAAQEAAQAAQTAEEAVSAAQQATQQAQASAQEAGNHAQAAAASAVLAQQAANAAGYVSFEIDTDGQLVYTKTAGLELTFELSEGVLIAHG